MFCESADNKLSAVAKSPFKLALMKALPVSNEVVGLVVLLLHATKKTTIEIRK